MSNSNRKKNILIIAGHDPCGGAGIQADAESIIDAGCRALSVITVLTSQNTQGVVDFCYQPAAQVKRQLEVLLDDIPVHACKTGLLGDEETVQIVAEILERKQIPLVVDPVLASGTGTPFTNDAIIKTIMTKLLPLSTVITPNSEEARQLTGQSKLDAAANDLLATGAASVLITGTHEDTAEVENTLYHSDGATHHYSWTRLANEYHGSGCTLAARIAALLALGENLADAVQQAQEYTWQALSHGEAAGKGQWLPDRFYNR